jgi:hypothetical protein
MAAITDLSALVNRMTGGNSGTPENLFIYKMPYVANVIDTFTAGAIYSTWKYDGYPAAGSNPGAVAAPTKATQGAIPFTNPGGGREKWLVQGTMMSEGPTDVLGILLYDRLLHIGGLSGTNTGAQTVGGTLTRNTGGVGNMIFFEIYTPVGTTATTITANYTDQDGNTGQTSGSAVIGGAANGIFTDQNVMVPIPLAAGDTGVRAVASVTLAASTVSTAGNFGITVARPLAWFMLNGRGAIGRDFTVGPGGMPEIDTDACLAMAMYVGSATEVGFVGMLSTVEA